MVEELPYLEVSGPDGQTFTVELPSDRLTIGRLRKYNDIALEPDPDQFITRVIHCSIEREAGSWWVVDNGSRNKTYIQYGQTTEIVLGRAPIGDGDVIRILGRWPEDADPIYWHLTFHDPLRTQKAEGTPRIAHLEYKWVQAQLYRVDDQGKVEIKGLRPQEHKMVRYMDQRNRANNDEPVMCTYDELIEAIWGEESYGRTEADVNRIAWELRKKIEPDQGEPQFLQTVRGMGYRLVTRPTGK